MPPTAMLVEKFGNYKLFATIIPPMDVFTLPRLFVFAVPDDDGRYSIVGQLSVPSVEKVLGDFSLAIIEWVEVDPHHRRRGLAKRMWLAAEKVLGYKIEGEGVSPEGEALVESIEKGRAA